jgi:hypothetical protein
MMPKKMMDKIISGRWLTANAALGSRQRRK